MCVYVCVWASVHFSIPVFICATLPQSEEEAAAAAAAGAAGAAATAGKAKEAKAKKKKQIWQRKNILRFSKIKKLEKNAAKICALRRCFIAAVDGSSNTNGHITLQTNCGIR